MASQWLIGDDRPQENVQKSKYEDLFVFGYGCKVFRDDEQAKLVDAGKYLIPWMGDERLMIDRYDGRGHLYDLTPYDADLRKGEQGDLSEEEKKLEALYDEERYLELHTDLTEKSIYEEEEWKRYYESLSEGYKAVGFSYDYYGQQIPFTEEAVKQEDPEEQAFLPPEELHVPAGMTIPETNKEAAIIEKTAKFIAAHGLQMEIMMKTKQANNPMFMFMHFEDTLHPYYRHVIQMIKSGKFKPKVKEKTEEDEHDEGHGEGDGQHSYLHPALLQTNRASPTPEVYKPVQMPKVSIHETSYGQLLKSMSKVNQEVAERMKPKEVKREIKTEPTEDSGLPACMAQPVYGASMSTHNGMPPPPGIEPVTLPQSTENGDGDVKLEPGGDDSTAMDHSHLSHIVPPPPDVQPVVDRMAMYVAKNGPEFEIVVKSKKDPRFEFLLSHHLHFAYYDFKKQLFIKELEREKAEKEKEKQDHVDEENTEEKEKDKSSAGAGIKFKVKVKGKEQEVVTLEKKTVFENESSDEENEDGESSERERPPKSGTSTPIADRRQKSEAKSDVDPSTTEKKLAEQRMRDRIAASAREKLGQVDKEKQLQAERKKRAAMFINMLKGSNTDGGGAQTNDKASLPEILASQTSSRANTPATSDRSSSSRQKSKSKRKHKDRRRSDSRDRSRSRDHSRSRSRSKSRLKKKKRKRSPTPPSAYAVVRRSPLRFPPPPPPRYQSHDRSPSNSRSSKFRSKSRSPVRSKSKKKKRSKSKSPSRSKEGKVKDSKSHPKTKKKKKKRSKSRSPSRKSSETKSPPPDIKKVDSHTSIQSVPSSERLPSPVAMETVESELEEGETREATDTEDNVIIENNVEQRSPSPTNNPSKSTRSRSKSRSPSMSRSRSPESVKSAKSGKSPPTSRHSSISRHSSRSRLRSPSIARSHSKSKSRSQSQSRSRSRHSSVSSRHSSHKGGKSRSRSKDRKSRSRSRSKDRKSRSRSKDRKSRLRSKDRKSRSRSHDKSSRKQSPLSPKKRSSLSPEGGSGSRAAIPSTPASPDKEPDSDSCASGTSTPKASGVPAPKKNVSQYMLSRVRAIIKASREATLKEDMPFLDDT